LLLGGVAAAAITVAAGLPLRGGNAPPGLAGNGIVATALGYVVLATLCRGVGYRLVRRSRRQRAAVPALVVGTGRIGAEIIGHLRAHPEYGLRPVGFVDDSPRPPGDNLPAPLLGPLRDLARQVHRYRIGVIFVAFGKTPDGRLVDAVRMCDRLPCETYLVPRLFEVGTATAAGVEHVWGIPCVRLGAAPPRTWTWFAKRGTDVVLAAAGLLLVSPLLLLIAIAVRLDGGPGVLYRQDRLTAGGRRFGLVKFRSLRPQPAQAVADGRPLSNEERMGRTGRFLRRSSLDELPQLWNILRGQMSLVGPRPEQPHLAEELARTHERYRARLRVPAGLTGLAQIHDLRGDTSIAERLRFDNLYIENWSFWLDVKIVLRTLGSVFGMRGA
jgi:exopolysaccharide biosynthesis polyprenyl glycosylphosphotransferase